MNVIKTIASMVLVFAILTIFLTTGINVSVDACECGEPHEAPFHIGDDIITLSESSSGDGWQWNHSTRTLTLTNANISNTIPEPFDPSYPGEQRPETSGKYIYDKTQNSVILLPPNSTIILNGNNIVTPVEDETIYSFAFAIGCVGQSLTIKGGGSLQSNGVINAHCLVFDGVNVTTNKNKTDEYGYNGISCYELHIKDSVVKNNAETGFVASFNIKNGVLYTKNSQGGDMPAAIYFFKNYDTSRFETKYKTATGYDGETVAGNAGDYTTFFEKRDDTLIEAIDIMIKDKITTSEKQSQDSNTSSDTDTSSNDNTSSGSSASSDTISSGDSNQEDGEILVNKQDVNIRYNKNVFPAATIMNVKLIDRGIAYQTTQQALSSISSKFVVYDIEAKCDDKNVQPNGVVYATFIIPVGYDADKTSVYHISEQGYEKIPSTTEKENMLITAELSHFSTYAVVEERSVNTEEEPKTQKQGYVLIIVIIVVMVLLFVGAYIIIRKKLNK